MNSWLRNPAFVAYALACVVLCVNLLFLWAYSGAVRARTKTAMNEEDAVTFGAALVPTDPPAVARVLRAHSNAQASTFPFLLLGIVFVWAGGGAGMAAALFGVFTAARVLHTVAYLKAWQPWRTVFFVVGVVAMVVLMADIVWMVVRTV